MGVRIPILSFTFFMLLLFAVCAAAYFILFSSRTELQHQYELFGEAAAATGNLETEANRLLYNDFIIQQSKFNTAVERYAQSRTAMGTVSSLKENNTIVSDSISSVDQLYTQNSFLIAEVENRLYDLIDSIKGPSPVNGWTIDYILFGNTSHSNDLDTQLREKARLLSADIHVLSEYLITSRQSVEQQGRVVYQEIDRIKKKTNRVLGIIIVFVILVSLVMAFRIASSIIIQNEKSKDELKHSRNEVIETASKLQSANEELNESIKKLNLAQSKLVLSEKLSALGQLAAGIAHELNSPLGAIISANNSIDRYLHQKFIQIIKFINTLNEHERAALITILSAKKPQRELIDLGPSFSEIKAAAEKLKTIGLSPTDRLSELVADHDFKVLLDTNPEIFSLPRSADLLEFTQDHLDAIRMTNTINLAASQASDVVNALRQYLNNDDEDDFKEVDIQSNIEMVLMLIHSKIKYGITIEKDFCDAKVFGSAQKLGQVWMNLIVNAIHAVNQKGTITLSSRIKGTMLEVSIQDNGKGVPPDIMDRIFEPFFTTKRLGEGLGLGLDICQRIIHTHDGVLEVTSTPGNTRFIVKLPLSKGLEKTS